MEGLTRGFNRPASFPRPHTPSPSTQLHQTHCKLKLRPWPLPARTAGEAGTVLAGPVLPSRWLETGLKQEKSPAC